MVILFWDYKMKIKKIFTVPFSSFELEIIEKFYLAFLKRYKKVIEKEYSGMKEVDIRIGINRTNPEMRIETGLQIVFNNFKGKEEFTVTFIQNNKEHCESAPAISTFVAKNYQIKSLIWALNGEKGLVYFSEDEWTKEQIINIFFYYNTKSIIILSIEDFGNGWNHIKFLSSDGIHDIWTIILPTKEDYKKMWKSSLEKGE